jgi:outer membrane protein assembly factor BamB
LSGRTGKTLWRLDEANPTVSFPPINFVNLLLVDDRNGDGLRDLLVVQGGGKDTRRLAARLHWVSSRDGSLLESRVVPDGNESYSLPLFQERPGERARFYVGTGGETLSGNLIRLRLPSFEEEWRVHAVAGGFVGSPAVVDLDGDGADEIIATDMDGAVYRIDAEAGRVGWRWRDRPRWTYASPAAGTFGADATLDVVATVNRGVFPESAGVEVLWLDGGSGRVLGTRSFEETTTLFTASSPLVLDVDEDGRDEVLLVLSSDFLDPTMPGNGHRLLILDGGDEHRTLYEMKLDGDSIATPRLADLDRNGKLDIVHAWRHGVLRLELNVSGKVRWGEMRGPNGAGIYARAPHAP